MSRTRAIAMAAVLLVLPMTLVTPRVAYADATLFVGANMTPANRTASGFAIGAGILLFGFEFEYAGTAQDERAGAPALRTGMGNVLLQTPVEIFGMQPYVTAGAGVYRESLDALEHQETNVGVNTGGGVKISLVGPLRLRLDYRVFSLSGDALHSTSHRIYAGLNLKF